MTIAADVLKVELRRFCTEHINLHGKTEASRRYVAANLDLWREAYGPDVARYVEVGVNQHWAGWWG